MSHSSSLNVFSCPKLGHGQECYAAWGGVEEMLSELNKGGREGGRGMRIRRGSARVCVPQCSGTVHVQGEEDVV